MLNILEGYDLEANGLRLRATPCTCMAEAMRRAFADRARYLGDPDVNPAMPIARLTSKEYAAQLRRTIRESRRSGLVAASLRVAGGERTRRRTSRWSTQTATRWR